MRFILLICALLSSLTGTAQIKAYTGSEKSTTPAQIQIGFKTGANLSIFSASINSDPALKPGFHFGAFLKIPTSSKLFFRPEFVFSSQGQKDNYIIPSSNKSVGSTKTTVNYFNVPLLFETRGKVFVQFGPQIGFLLSGKEKGTIEVKK
jgi:hypothetical protein